jgi:hypothetical protein
MFINVEGHARSLRSQPAKGGELLLVVGDGHLTGTGNPTNEHYGHLEEKARSIYTVRSIDYHMSPGMLGLMITCAHRHDYPG